MDLAIDTLGGNIVQAKLLQYPKELHSKEPIELFSDNPENYYLQRAV